MQSFSFRLLAILVTFFVGVFAVSIWVFENQTKFTEVAVNLPVIEPNKSDLVPVFDPNEDYDVYSAILANHKRDDEVLIISEDTSIGLIVDAKGLSTEISTLTDDTIKDFSTKNEKSHKLQNNFSIENRVVLISEAEEKNASSRNNGLGSLSTKYPKARAILTFSRVGFNQERTQALVYFTFWCDPLCGSGDFIFLQKMNGRWIVEKQVGLWVS